jgi:hypothetical protein
MIPIELINKINMYMSHPSAVIIKEIIKLYHGYHPYWKYILHSISCHIETKNTFIWFDNKLHYLKQHGEYSWVQYDN